LDEVGHVEHGAEGAADRFAVLDDDGGAVGAVGHDLHGGAVGAEDGHADEFVAHVGQRGLDGGGDARLQRGIRLPVRGVVSRSLPLARGGRGPGCGAFLVRFAMRRVVVQENKKGGPLRPPPPTVRKMMRGR
jgi:hypothetical protein